MLASQILFIRNKAIVVSADMLRFALHTQENVNMEAKKIYFCFISMQQRPGVINSSSGGVMPSGSYVTIKPFLEVTTKNQDSTHCPGYFTRPSIMLHTRMEEDISPWKDTTDFTIIFAR